jgi:Tfp pilus assembly ATPase PilU
MNSTQNPINQHQNHAKQSINNTLNTFPKTTMDRLQREPKTLNLHAVIKDIKPS